MGKWFYWLAEIVLTPFVAWLYRHDARGVEHIPQSGPVIIASNHLSHIDPLLLAKIALKMRPKRYTRFLAKAELFEKWPLSWVMAIAHHVPVERGKASASDALLPAKEMLALGEVLVIFPEGTISPMLVPMKPYTGVGRLARDTGVPVVPAALWGEHRTWTKFRPKHWKAHRPVTMTFGEPVVYGPDESPSDVTDDIMRRIVECVDDCRRRYPEQPGPDDWWGPPDWPEERAGKWRPKLDKSMSDEESLAVARRALYGDDLGEADREAG